MFIPPFWQIASSPDPGGDPRVRTILFEKGLGWGNGNHPTTQLCLQGLAHFRMRHPAGPFDMLDVGCGSGLLAIGAALLGGTVDGVEIQDSAIEHARINAQLNGVEDRLRFAHSIQELDGAGYDLVLANIFNTLLLELAPSMVAALKPTGTLILSGILATDVPVIAARFGGMIDNAQAQSYRKGEWHALAWWRSA